MEKQGICQEVMAATQAGDDSSWDHSGRGAGKEKWPGSGSISEVGLTRFPKEPMECVIGISVGIRNDLESI